MIERRRKSKRVVYPSPPPLKVGDGLCLSLKIDCIIRQFFLLLVASRSSHAREFKKGKKISLNNKCSNHEAPIGIRFRIRIQILSSIFSREMESDVVILVPYRDRASHLQILLKHFNRFFQVKSKINYIHNNISQGAICIVRNIRKHLYNT